MVAYIPPKQAGKYKAVASGAITNGKPVIVNADGTVSVVSSDPDSLGSATDLYDGGFSFPAVVYDTGQDKFLLVYTDDSNSYYGTGVVGTVSGSSISFGTPVVFSSATSYYISATFDSNAGKTGIFWADYDDSERGKACVATISGTSVSYGSTVTFNSTASSSGLKDSTFDSSQNKIVLVYRKDSSNGEVVAATISGTDISFGSATSLYGTQFGSFNKVGITYDSNAKNPSKYIIKLFNQIKLQLKQKKTKTFTISINDNKHQLKNTECGMFSMNFIINMLKRKNTFEIVCNSKTSDDEVFKLREKYFN